MPVSGVRRERGVAGAMSRRAKTCKKKCFPLEFGRQSLLREAGGLGGMPGGSEPAITISSLEIMSKIVRNLSKAMIKPSLLPWNAPPVPNQTGVHLHLGQVHVRLVAYVRVLSKAITTA